MGIGIVLLFWAVIGAIVAVIGSLVLGGATSLLVLGVERGRNRAIVTACLLPFACLGWLAVTFVFQAVINETVLHRDMGIGDGWHCPLPNGYQISMIDVTDQGEVYKPKAQGLSAYGSEREDVVGGVRIMQVAGRYILGGMDTHYSDRHEGSTQVDSFFLLDTQLEKRTTFSDYDALRDAAIRLGIEPNLETIYDVYWRFRFSWFDVLTVLLLFTPPIVAFALLIRRIVRLRRTREPRLCGH